MMDLPVRRPRSDHRRDISTLLSGRSPFLSIYLDVSPGESRASAAERLGRALTVRSTDNPQASRIEELSLGQRAQATAALDLVHDEDSLLAAFIDADGFMIATGYPDPPHHDVVEVANAPRIGPLLNAEQSLNHHVVALVDDAEISLMAVPRHGEATVSSYTATDRMAIAPLVHHAARVSKTRLVILCARSELLPRLQDQVRLGLPVTTSLLVVPVDGLSESELATEIVVRTATHAAYRTVELLRLWRFHHSHQEAVDGAQDTLDALGEGRAALVLVHDDAENNRQAWFQEGANRIIPVIEFASLQAGAEHGLLQGRLSDVVIRAAITSSCPVHVTPNVTHTLTDGIGAILNDRASKEDLAELLEG